MGTSRLSREEQIRSKTRKFCTKISKAHRTNTGALSGNHLFFFFFAATHNKRASLVAQMVNNPRVTQETGSIPGSRRSRGEENGYSLQSCLENSRDRGAWWATVHGVAKSLT